MDAAAVVDGLVVDMRYFGEDNFVGARIDGYEAAALPADAPGGGGAGAVQRDLVRRRVSGSRSSIATGRRARWRISCAGRATSRT